MNPHFSIVIPAYNRPRELARALRSCLRQSFTSFEVVVVDDGSEEDLLSIVRRFDDLRLRYVRQTNRGGGAARNRGVSVAIGHHIAFLDSDDIFLPDKLATMYELAKRDPDGLYCSPVFVDRGVGKLWIKPRVLITQNDDIFDYLFLKDGWIPMSSVVVMNTIAKRAPFNEDLACGQDVQFAVDVAKLGTKFLMAEEPLVVCDDRRSSLRVSQKANIDAAGIGPYGPYLDWMESLRPAMSARAYNAWRAKFKARLIVSDAPQEAFRYLWTAYRSGALTTRGALRRASQIFAPNLYWEVSNSVAKLWGAQLAGDVRRLISDYDGALADKFSSK